MIEVQGISVDQGNFQLRDISFLLDTGMYGVLMGRSGCGKTTIMEVICGLRRAMKGKVQLDELDVTQFRPGDRGIGYVPQDGALFPTLRVRDQIGFAMRIRRAPPPQITERVDQLADMLGIQDLLDRYPRGLSGGETQRVALGRALAVRPRILCLDEPLSALDDDTRDEMVHLLKDLHRDMPVTTLHITHHQREARKLADQLFVLEDGKLQRQ